MNVFLDMVGCRLNQSEIEALGRQFRQAGHTLVSQARLADLVVINTCTVTGAAASDSRQKVRQAVKSGASQVIATGCYATLNPELLTQLPGPIQVIGNADKDQLVPLTLGLPASSFTDISIQRQPLPGARLRTRAFIKVQDGCDNHCTYCITRLARGESRSRPVDAILADILSALDGGCQEIVITGVHLGSWGADFDPPSQLLDLLNAILGNTFVPRVHFSSIEPWDITTEFLNAWQDKRLCRHLHLPLQSGCAATLMRMGRKITPAAYADLVSLARQLIPGVSITTDVITGFPGETQEEFDESLAFVRQMAFAGGHVFTYSPRPGTPATRLPGQVNPAVAKRRNAQVRQVLQQSASFYRQSYLGKDLSVLWEKAVQIDQHLWRLSGLSDNYLRVHAFSPAPCQNQAHKVRIKAVETDSLLGEIILTPPQGFPN